jgi:hypothetical protein
MITSLFCLCGYKKSVILFLHCTLNRRRTQNTVAKRKTGKKDKQWSKQHYHPTKTWANAGSSEMNYVLRSYEFMNSYWLICLYIETRVNLRRDHELWRWQTYIEDSNITFITSLFMSLTASKITDSKLQYSHGTAAVCILVPFSILIPVKNIPSHHINIIHILKMKIYYVYNYLESVDVGFWKENVFIFRY